MISYCGNPCVLTYCALMKLVGVCWGHKCRRCQHDHQRIYQLFECTPTGAEREWEANHVRHDGQRCGHAPTGGDQCLDPTG